GVEYPTKSRAEDGVVVDHENADAHAVGTSTARVVPAPGEDSIVIFPPTRPTRSCIPMSPRAPRRGASGVKPRPSSSTTAEIDPSLRTSEMLTLRASACF